MLTKNLGYKNIFDQYLINISILPLKSGAVKVCKQRQEALRRTSGEVPEISRKITID